MRSAFRHWPELFAPLEETATMGSP
jgi:hypothetical protein